MHSGGGMILLLAIIVMLANVALFGFMWAVWKPGV